MLKLLNSLNKSRLIPTMISRRFIKLAFTFPPIILLPAGFGGVTRYQGTQPEKEDIRPLNIFCNVCLYLNYYIIVECFYQFLRL